MQLAPPPIPPVVVHWLLPEKLFYQEWEFWLSLFTFALAVVTGWLALETRGLRKDSAESIKAAQQSAEGSYQLLRASVRPVINVELTFQQQIGPDGLNNVFTNWVVIHIHNTGTAALVLERVIASWQHDEEGLVGNVEAPGFRKSVLSSGNERKERISIYAHGSSPNIEHFDSWSDFFQVEVHCRDLGGITPITYLYRPADGVSLLMDNHPKLT